MQRGYDSVVHDIALQNLPVVMCIDRAGLNFEDGATHHGIFDVAFLSHIPNIKIYTPATLGALEAALEDAYASGCPCAVRYPKGGEDRRVAEEFYSGESGDDRQAGRGELGIRTNFSAAGAEELDGMIIVHGRMASKAIDARDILREEGIRVGIVLVEVLKSYARLAELIADVLPRKAATLVSVEEEIRAGGAGMLIWDKLKDFERAKNKDFRIIALDDDFCPTEAYANADEMYDAQGLGADDIAEEFRKKK